MATDQVPITQLLPNEREPQKRPSPKKTGWSSVKSLVLLFLLFIFISSDVFIDNVVGLFKDSTDGTNLTTYGTAVQGVFLVFFYAVALHVEELGVL